MKHEHDYENYTLFMCSNNMIFIGKLAMAIDCNKFHITNVTQISQTPQGGLNISPPIFPCSDMVLCNPAAYIDIKDLEVSVKNMLMKTLTQYWAQKQSGIIVT